MKLEAFHEKNKKKTGIIIGICSIVLLLAVVIVYRTYSIFEEKQEFDVIKGIVPDQNYDAMFAFTLEDENGNKSSIASIPEGTNYNVTVSCNNGATGVWDYEVWGPRITNLTQTRTKCYINFEPQYVDSVLNGANPVLSDGLIPVTIASDGSVRKADIQSEWYNYSNKTWANAVILSDESVSYQNGEVIPESNIESYFVWIPRYRYKIFNDGNYEGLASVENKVQAIEVVFESTATNASAGTGNGQWLTHPAFTNFGVNGIWVGKFETGYKGATSTAAAQVDSSDSGNIQIKPNVYSWRNIRVANAFTASYNYRREMDSHMIKNTEWGAVAYLQHSIYGSQASVRINNNESYITGYAAKNEPTCGFTDTNEICNKYESTSLGADGTYTINYLNTGSVVASTTGNYSGVYDMSGGAWEYVMGVMLDQNGNLVSGRNDKYNSNFIGTLTYPNDGTNTSKTSWTAADGGVPYPESKYYDTYAYSTVDKQYNRRILGDATGEMGPFAHATYGSQTRQIGSWYADEAWFVSQGNPWFARGTNYGHGTDAGVFAFSGANGSVYGWVGVRVVLAF